MRREMCAVAIERGWLFLTLRDGERAQRDFERALESEALTPWLASRLVQGQVQVLLSKGRPEEALETLSDGRRIYKWPIGSREETEIWLLEAEVRFWCGEPAELENLSELEGRLAQFEEEGELLKAALAIVVLVVLVLRGVVKAQEVRFRDRLAMLERWNEAGVFRNGVELELRRVLTHLREGSATIREIRDLAILLRAGAS